MKNEAANGNIQLNLHGLQLNITTIIAAELLRYQGGALTIQDQVARIEAVIRLMGIWEGH